jgi:hypothetical protein
MDRTAVLPVLKYEPNSHLTAGKDREQPWIPTFDRRTLSPATTNGGHY